VSLLSALSECRERCHQSRATLKWHWTGTSVLCARAVWRHASRSVVTQRLIVLILYVLVRKQCYLREVFVKHFCLCNVDTFVTFITCVIVVVDDRGVRKSSVVSKRREAILPFHSGRSCEGRLVNNVHYKVCRTQFLTIVYFSWLICFLTRFIVQYTRELLFVKWYVSVRLSFIM
jgi:hypothetical protein